MSEGNSIISEQLIDIFENVMKMEQEFVVRESKKRLSMTEVHTIAAIGIEELSSMSEIAKKLHITVGTLTVSINNLVKKDYVERYKSEKDRRIVKIGLTKQGKEIYRIHEAFHRNLATVLLKNLTEPELAGAKKALDNLAEFIEQGYQDRDTIQK